jgi:hypothetical protein
LIYGLTKYKIFLKKVSEEFSNMKFPMELSKKEEEKLLRDVEEASKEHFEQVGIYPPEKLLRFMINRLYSIMILKESSKIELSEEEEEEILQNLQESSKKHFEKFGEYHSKEYLEAERLRISKSIKLEKYESRKVKTSPIKILDSL